MGSFWRQGARSLSCFFVFVLLSGRSNAQVKAGPGDGLDSDHDGMSDALEQALLQQFVPTFMIATSDCSTRPARFTAGVQEPEVASEDGTLYGQAFLKRTVTGQGTTAELHFYHLWKRDCGGHGHPLDAEHVSVLVHTTEQDLLRADWKATYWYAAAHEDTVCDVSQISRASTLHAEDHGARIWISAGKHASYLNDGLCDRGCAADRCQTMTTLHSPELINLGEIDSPMHGAVFTASAAWPLSAKMLRSDFPSEPLERLQKMPDTDIAWFHSGRHPAQGIIAKSSRTEASLAASTTNTSTAISLAGNSATDAISKAGDSTGDAVSAAGGATGGALEKSYKHTKHALGKSARHVRNALRLDRNGKKQEDGSPE